MVPLKSIAALCLCAGAAFGQAFSQEDIPLKAGASPFGVVSNAAGVGILFWYEADVGAFTNDQSGNGFNIPGTNYTLLPNQVNGKPAVRLDNDGVLFPSPHVVAGQPYVIFMVLNTGSLVGSGTALTANPEIYFDSGFVHILLATDVTSGTTWPTNRYNLLTIIVNGASSSIRQNGVEVATGDGTGHDLNAFNWTGNGVAPLFMPEAMGCTNLSGVTNTERYFDDKYNL